MGLVNTRGVARGARETATDIKQGRDVRRGLDLLKEQGAKPIEERLGKIFGDNKVERVPLVNEGAPATYRVDVGTGQALEVSVGALDMPSTPESQQNFITSIIAEHSHDDVLMAAMRDENLSIEDKVAMAWEQYPTTGAWITLPNGAMLPMDDLQTLGKVMLTDDAPGSVLPHELTHGALRLFTTDAEFERLTGGEAINEEALVNALVFTGAIESAKQQDSGVLGVLNRVEKRIARFVNKLQGDSGPSFNDMAQAIFEGDLAKRGVVTDVAARDAQLREMSGLPARADVDPTEAHMRQLEEQMFAEQMSPAPQAPSPAGPHIEGPDMTMPPLAAPEQLQKLQQLGEQELAAQQSAAQDGSDMLFSTFSPRQPPSPGQKGWGGGNMSLRAEQAIADGKRTASMIAKEYGLSTQTVRNMLRTREYHHILPEGRKTPVAEYFYEFDPKNDEVDAAKLVEMRAKKKGKKTESLQKRTRTLAAKKLGLKHSAGSVTDADGNFVGGFLPWGLDASYTKNPDAARAIAESLGLNKGLDGNYYIEEESHPTPSIVLKGERAMERVINEHIDVPSAMSHPLIGDISFYWGNAKGGVAHIIEGRNAQNQDGLEAARHMVRVIAEGILGEPYQNGQRINISLAEASAVLDLHKDGTSEKWLLTGWKEAAPGETGASYNRQSYTRQSSVIHTDAGARANETIPQSPPDVNQQYSTAQDAEAAQRPYEESKFPGLIKDIAAKLDQIGKPVAESPTQVEQAEGRYSTASDAGVPEGANDRIKAAAAKEWAEKKTDSRFFKKWFGDSKVVDDGGKPLVVYHGTGGEFSVFEEGYGKEFRERGIHTTDNIEAAKAFGPEGRSPMPLYVNIRNPLTIDAKGKHWTNIDFEGRNIDADELANIARERGNDGVIIKNISDPSILKGNTYIALSPEQIKSATGNQGTFDATNPDIRYSTESEADAAIKLAEASIEDLNTLNDMLIETEELSRTLEEYAQDLDEYRQEMKLEKDPDARAELQESYDYTQQQLQEETAHHQELQAKIDEVLAAIGNKTRTAQAHQQQAREDAQAGRLTYEDDTAAPRYSTATSRTPLEGVAYTPPEMDSTTAASIVSKVTRYFGITNDFRETGYVRPDGKMLDLSGKKQGGQPGHRHLDHRDVPDLGGAERYDDMLSAIDAGIARVDFNVGLVHISQSLTSKQKAVILRGMEQTGTDYVRVEVNDGKQHNPVYVADMDGSDTKSLRRALNEADAVMRGERKPESVEFSGADGILYSTAQGKDDVRNVSLALLKQFGLRALHADFENIHRKHSDYFASPLEAQLFTEEVLSAPEMLIYDDPKKRPTKQLVVRFTNKWGLAAVDIEEGAVKTSYPLKELRDIKAKINRANREGGSILVPRVKHDNALPGPATAPFNTVSVGTAIRIIQQNAQKVKRQDSDGPASKIRVTHLMLTFCCECCSIRYYKQPRKESPWTLSSNFNNKETIS